MADNKTDSTLDSQIDDDFILDDIEDLAGFVTPPNGAYLFRLDKGIEEKVINEKNYYEVPLTLVSVVEMNDKLDEGEEMPKAGDVATLIFKRDNKFGMGNFKNFVKSIAEKTGARTVGEVREQAKGMEMLVILKRKWNKDSERYNLNVVKSVVN